MNRRAADRIKEIAECELKVLSERQKFVLCQIAKGSTSGQIAQLMGASIKTVEAHRGQIVRQLGMSMYEAVSQATRAEWV